MKLLGTIQGTNITLGDDNVIRYTTKADVDCDGSPNWRRDPCGQADTSLHYQGKPINADAVPYIVVPPLIIDSVPEIVLGSLAIVTNTLNGKKVVCVVADKGPHLKIGELSTAAAAALGLNPSPTEGGTDSHIILYELYPGTPATVNGITYDLQAST